MPMPDLAVPAFPDVPAVPGVPGLLRLAGASLPLPVREVADALGLGSLLGGGPSWGIFLNGKPVIVGDSVVTVGYVGDARISDYPVEGGAFASYNKVQMPFLARLGFAIGGTFSVKSVLTALGAGSFGGALSALTGGSARAEFLAKVEEARKSLDLYTVVTPEATYASASVVHIDYHRDARSATLIKVDVWLEEVRPAPPAAFSSTNTQASASPPLTNTQQPSGADPVDGGTVQAPTPPADQPQAAIVPSSPPPAPGPEATTQPPPADASNPQFPTANGRPDGASRDASYAAAKQEPGYRDGDRIDDYGRNTTLAARNHTLVNGH